MISPMNKPVSVLYLGSLTHSDQTNSLDKSKPHQDQIQFENPVKICLIRIPRPGKDIYSRHISITQNQTIKNFEIYYRNLEKTNGRFCLLTSNNELLASSTDDILITPKQPIFTDLLLIKGNFTKITFCIYGNVIREENLIQEKCPNYRSNAMIEPLDQNLIQIKKDIFEEKREIIREVQNSLQNDNNVEEWSSVGNDDGINEQQIENICNLSQKLLSTYTSQQLSQEPFVVEFRAGLEQISANLSKIFKNKHLGLYYPSYEDSNISHELPLSVTKLALSSLNLSLSQQFRGLQILKFVLQLDRHADFFIQNKGVQMLIQIFVNFFKINSVVLSTYKNVILEVLICVSYWKKATSIMTEIIQDPFYHDIFEQRLNIKVQKLVEQRQRSRQKKNKKSRSESPSSEDQDKKRKKDKQKKRNKQKEKKKAKQPKTKEQLIKKTQQIQQPQKAFSLREQVPNLSFYEVLLYELYRQTNSKQLILIKILLQQILQTITKNKIVSHRVSLSTSLLKDIKYIFNPAGQVLNTKSLKQFASCYQPFLNNVQSQGVESELVSEREKLKNMKKYGISPKICKIINKISLQIASSQSQQNSDQTKTPFDSSFIVMMSELIRHKQKSVLYGFGRILTTFKIGSSNDIIYLKKIEAAMTMISQYIYKILVQDNGLYTVLNIDQIYTSLINITNCLSKDSSAFTKQLKRKIRQLTNYAMAYDLFNRSQGNFKSISDYFLRLFKFEHYEINKISDFKKKEFDKLTNPFTEQNLTEAINLGSFHQLFPDQPLLQIDVYLKIFNVLLQYNKNVWPLFYQNKLLCGFSVLFIKLTNITTFLLHPSIQRQSILTNTKKTQITIENYLNVLSRLLNILVRKAEYESAFNELIEQDNFQNVQIYEKCFELYISLFNAINQNSSLLFSKYKNLAKQILSMILQIFDKLMQSYELTSHGSRQSKLKQLWCMIYESHYVNLRSRAACLSLYAFFIQSMENASIKLFNTYCIQQTLKLQVYAQHAVKGYLPNNDKSILQNLILSNIFRNDPLIQTNLSYIIKNLLEKNSQKNPTCEKVTPYLQNIFDEIEQKLKEKGNYVFQQKKQLVLLQKMVLFTDVLRKLNCVLTSKFQQKLLKYLKVVDNVKRDGPNDDNPHQKTAFKLSLKIKINIISFLKKGFSQRQQHPQILYFVQLLNKNLQTPQRVVKGIQTNQIQSLSQLQMGIQRESLNLVNCSLEAVCAFSSNPYNQSVVLYQVFLEKPYKPVPQISLVSLFARISSTEIVKFICSQGNEMSLEEVNGDQTNGPSDVKQLKQTLKQIMIRLTYFLCLLTTIQSRQFYSTQSRRNALTCILTQEKQFPFSRLQQFKDIIPAQFLQTLRDYYSYPIIQKPLTLRSQEKKEVVKNRGYLFSKSVFSIIMQGEPTAKSRYPYIGGPWKGGDIHSNALYTPSRQRDYLKIVSKCLKPLHFLQDKVDLSFKTKTTVLKSTVADNQLFELNTKKRTKNLDKKSLVDVQIKLLKIPLVLQNQNVRIEQTQMINRISPSPSNKYQNAGYGKGSHSLGNEYDGNTRMTSPSPPANKIPSQSMIGFNSLNQPPTQYGSQNIPNSMQGSVSNGQMGNMTQQPLGTQPHVLPGMQNIESTSSMKHNSYKYGEYPNTTTQPMQPQSYPNPYYGGSPVPKLGQEQKPPVGGTLPYLQMQKAGSQQLGNGQVRSSSNSASRQNPPYPQGANYSHQQPYYGSNTQYSGQPPTHQKMGGYDNRSHSPYQKNYQMNQGYSSGQRMQYPNNMQSTGGYQPQQNQSYGGNYPQGNMMGNNPRAGYQNMGGRPYNNNNPQYGAYNYPNQPVPNQSYTPTNYQNQNSTYLMQEQRQFNEAILLVTELRGTLPDHLKIDKKSRLNEILRKNVSIQNRVKEYINNLK